MKYALIRSVILKDASKASGVSSVVNRTMVRESPSTPMWKVELRAAYQIILFLELETGLSRLELCPQENRQNERDQAGAKGRPANGFQVILAAGITRPLPPGRGRTGSGSRDDC